VRRLSTLQAPCDCAIHDGLHGIPGEAERGGRGIHGATGLQDLDGKGFEEEGESKVLACPRRHHCFHAMLRASASWESGDRFRRELHGVEVPPTPLIGVIGKPAGTAAFRATDTGTRNQRASGESRLAAPPIKGPPTQPARRRRSLATGYNAQRVFPSRHSTTPKDWKRPPPATKFPEEPSTYDQSMAHKSGKRSRSA
jgi:hypothetical protein